MLIILTLFRYVKVLRVGKYKQIYLISLDESKQICYALYVIKRKIGADGYGNR